jgi:hypothetical protein
LCDDEDRNNGDDHRQARRNPATGAAAPRRVARVTGGYRPVHHDWRKVSRSISDESPLTRQVDNGLLACKVHAGSDWLYVLSGRLRLRLGEDEHILERGEAAEFSMRPCEDSAMDCVCGCGREIEGVTLTQRNFVAASVALELLAWDKNRASPTPGPDGRVGLIARGADCYQRLIYSLHGEGGGDPDGDCDEWLRESGEMRLQRSDMNKKQWLLGRGTGSPNLSEHDMAQLDRLHPELSFTGKVATRSGGQEAPVGGAGQPAPVETDATLGDDLVGKLERLRALRDDGVLTEDEFAAAKARLLG